MIFNEQEVDDTDKIIEGWKDYFSELYSTGKYHQFLDMKCSADMTLESGDFPVLSFFITICISPSGAISIGVPSFSEFSSISFCNFTNSFRTKESKNQTLTS
jgi:hypothetical protein